MSLEIAIQELTAAINNAVLMFPGRVLPHVPVDQAGFETVPEPVKEEPAPPPAEPKKKAKTAPAPKPEPEPEPEPEQAFEELLEEIDESFDEPSIQLPAGERNAAYYAAHVRPVLLQLGAKDKPALANLVQTVFNAKKGDLIPADHWDDLVAQANKLLAA